MPSVPATHTSSSSSSVPRPPGSARKASAATSIRPLRWRMSAVTTSSSASVSATSSPTSASGMTPSVCRPPARTPRATAPIIETRPPPETRSWPRRAISAPTSAASSTWAGWTRSDEEQNTQMRATDAGPSARLRVGARGGPPGPQLVHALVAGVDQKLDGLVDVVGDIEQVDVRRRDHAPGEHRTTDPVEQPLPVVTAEQHDRERRHLVGLHQDERLEELVEGAEPARQDDESLGVLDEHRLAGKEVPEVDRALDPLVDALLERQLDPETDGDAAGLAGALVGGLHRARAAAGDHGEARVDESAPEAFGHRVLRVVARRACGTEDADRRTELGQRPEALDELRLDAEDPARVGVHPVGRPSAVEQPLVGRRVRYEAAPQRHGAFAVVTG